MTSIQAAAALALALALAVILWQTGRAAADALDKSIAQLEGVCGPNAEPIIFTFSDTIHFQGDFALPEGMVFPFKGDFPVNTVVRLTVPGLPGAPEIEVPINTSIPIDMAVPIPGGITIPVDTELPIHQQFPVDLCAEGSEVARLTENGLAELRALRLRLPFAERK